MPPFAGKATLSEQERAMLALEREAAPAIAAALAKLERDLFRGVAEDDAETELLRRLDDPETAQALRDTLMTHLQAAALAGAGFGREQIEREVFGVKGIFGIDWDLANNAAAQWALNFVGNLIGVGDLVAPGAPESLIKQIMDTTRDRVRREVSEFVTNSETMTDLRRRLESVFSPQRAEMIAATEVTRAFAEGNMASWREAGVVERRRWNTANDEIVCPICGPRHNMVVALGESFDGIAAPPAHPRCRCWITPVVEDAEEREVGVGPVVAPAPLQYSAFDRGTADAWGQDQYRVWAASLSADEREAIQNYRVRGYRQINSELRSGSVSQDTATTRAAIDNALSRTPVPENITVYRGMSQAHLPNLEAGAVFVDRGYTSTSLLPDTLSAFLSDARESGEVPVMAEIRVPRGTPAAYLESLGNIQGEHELLLMRDTRYRVVSSEASELEIYGRKRSGIRLILEVIGGR